jgi:nickel-dependent lactate racemase
VLTACREPIGSPPLAELARRHGRALITVSDRTRPVPNRVLAPVLLEELSAAGIPPERVTVLVATGLHHPPDGQELVEILGSEVLERCHVLGHDARNESAQVAVGRVGGRAVLMDRAYVEAPLRIVTGLIEPHLMAGYSGGRKGVCPGVLAAESILHWHRPELLAHPRAIAGVLDGNPVDEEAHDIVRLAPPHFLLNVTIDRLRRMTGVFAGDWEEAWRAGVRHVAGSVVIPVPSVLADVVVTSAGGYPLDATFYQAIKGIVAAASVVRPGGVVILAASLAEGIGSADFAALFQHHHDPQDFLDHIHGTSEVRIDQWQAQVLAQVRRKAEVWVYGEGLSPEVLRSLYVEPLASVEEGIERASTLLRKDCSILYLPEGPYIAPVLTAAGFPTGSPAAPS